MALLDDVRNVLESYGLGSLAQWIIDQEVAGKDPVAIYTEMRTLPQYRARFPAMDALQKRAQAGTGVAITEAQYLEMERAYRQAFALSGLPANMWDTPDDFARLITADVSPNEVERRIAAAKEAAEATDPEVRDALLRMYGITTTDLMAYALDPQRTSEYIQRVARTSLLAGFAEGAGLDRLTTSQWESYAQDLLNQQVDEEAIREMVSSARILDSTQSLLAEIEGGRFTTSDALDVTVRKDADKMLASQRRVEREKARFSGTSGITTKTLGSTSI